MINTSKKGNKAELRARKELQAAGWNIVFKSIRTRFNSQDFASLFDVCAFKETKYDSFDAAQSGICRRYISIKHLGKGDYHCKHQLDIKKFREDYGLLGESYELWLWVSPRWVGRGKNKEWHEAHWEQLVIE